MSEFWNNGNYIAALGGILVWIGSGLAVWGVYKTNQQSSAKDQHIIELTQEFAAYATGGDSFVFLHIEGFGTSKPKAKIVHQGKYPVRDIELLIFDISSQMPDAKAGRLSHFDLSEKFAERRLSVIHPVWSKVFNQFPLEQNPVNDYYAYFINIDAHNGAHRQILQLQKIHGVWRQAYKIQRGPQDKRETRVLHFDPEFLKAQPELRRILEALPDRDQNTPINTSDN